MPTYNFTGRPVRMLTPDSDEIPSDGFAEVVTVDAVERDVLALNDGRLVPGVVSCLDNQGLRSPWFSDENQIRLTSQDAIIVNAQVAAFMEARNIRVNAQVWSPGITKRTPDGVVYADAPIRHRSLTTIYR